MRKPSVSFWMRTVLKGGVVSGLRKSGMRGIAIRQTMNVSGTGLCGPMPQRRLWRRWQIFCKITVSPIYIKEIITGSLRSMPKAIIWNGKTEKWFPGLTKIWIPRQGTGLPEGFLRKTAGKRRRVDTSGERTTIIPCTVIWFCRDFWESGTTGAECLRSIRWFLKAGNISGWKIWCSAENVMKFFMTGQERNTEEAAGFI